MANITITNLLADNPATTPLDGTEGVELVQGGVSVGALLSDVVPLAWNATIPDDAAATIGAGGAGAFHINYPSGNKAIGATEADSAYIGSPDLSTSVAVFDGSIDITGNTQISGALEVTETITGKRPIGEYVAGASITDASRTLVTNAGASGTNIYLLDDLAIGYEFQFYCSDDFDVWITANTGLTLDFFNEFDGIFYQASTDTATHILLNRGMSASVCKISATQWAVTSNNGGTYDAD